MRLTWVLILTISIYTSASVWSQTSHISVKKANVSLQELFNTIENETEYRFFYNNDEVDVSHKITISLSNQPVGEILTEAFKGLPYIFKELENKLILIENRDRSNVTAGIQQQRTVSGNVTDSSGTPLSGVSVVIKGTTKGVITDADGRYSLPDVPLNATLAFSFVGMVTQEIPTGTREIIRIIMMEDAVGLEEVVAVGYGTQKKANLTGAVGVASAERLENRTITAVGQGLQGVIPGLNITYNSGDPNESADFNVRGFESINGGSPLILVDGVPMNVEKINTNDVKSVSVLKDASSAAIYGARASFGVVLVETKKGQTGKTNVNFSSQLTMQKAIFPGYEPIKEGGTARKVMNEAYKLTLGRDLLPETIINAALAYQEMDNPTTDDAWMYYEGYLYPLENTYMKDLAMTDFSPQQQYDLSINGASEKASYYVSIGVIDKKGFYRYGNEKYDRYNVLSNLDFKINDWISLEEKISFSSVINDDPHNYGDQWYYQSIAKHFYSPHTFPDLTYYVEPGDHDKYAHLIGMHLDNRNPLPFLKKGGRDTRTENDIWLTQGITISPLKGLKIKGDFSYNYYWRDAESVQSKVEVVRGSINAFQMDLNDIIYYGQSANDWIENSFTQNTYYVFNAFTEYTLEGIKNHYAKALLGFNQEYGKNHRVTTASTLLVAPNIPSLTATTGTRTNSDSKNELMLRGMFYRLNYSYKDKYLFEANGRYDGTSRFPKKSRFGFFPSFSAGWRLSEELFMSSSKNWLDQLKIRASYGQLGNQNVGSYYPYISSMTSGTSNFLLDGGGTLTNTIAPGGLVSSTLTWETVVSKNVGIDITFLNRKLDVTYDYFIRDTKDMLMQKSYPGTLGATAPSENAADLKNTGWELAVTWSNKINNDWSYRVNLSLSDYETEITKYDNPTGAIGSYYVGKKVGEIWGYKTIGLFQSEEELAEAADQSRLGANWKVGDVHFADLDGDEVITTGSNTLDDTGDRIRIGNTTPRYSFGLNPSVRYKNFSLDMFFQGILKRQWYPATGNFLRFWPFKSLSMEQWWIDDSWSPENTGAYFPIKQYAYSDGKNTSAQTRYLQNAAYIRLKNITLSYNLPLRFVTNAQVYLNGANLWEASGMYKTFDPEDLPALTPKYMFHRSFTLGVKVTF